MFRSNLSYSSNTSCSRGVTSEFPLPARFNSDADESACSVSSPIVFLSHFSLSLGAMLCSPVRLTCPITRSEVEVRVRSNFTCLPKDISQSASRYARKLPSPQSFFPGHGQFFVTTISLLDTSPILLCDKARIGLPFRNSHHRVCMDSST